MKMGTACWWLVIGVISGAAGTSLADIYQWVDSKGIVHFTDDPDKIPAKYRKQVKERDMQGEALPHSQAVPQERPAVGTPAPAPLIESGLQAGEESLWRSRFGALRSELKGLQDGLVIKKEQQNELRRQWLVTQKGSARLAVNRMEEEIAKDEARMREVERLLVELDNEASRAAVPLEWRK